LSAPVDEEKVCRDCTQPFVFYVRDQEFFLKMNFTPPNRCKPCRDKRKAESRRNEQLKPPNGASPGRPPVRAPLGVSTSNPVTEYRPRFDGAAPQRAPNPTTVPSRDDKNDGRRRRGKWREDSRDGADW